MKPRFITPQQFVWNMYQCYINLGYPLPLAAQKAWQHLENLARYDAERQLIIRAHKSSKNCCVECRTTFDFGGVVCPGCKRSLKEVSPKLLAHRLDVLSLITIV